MWREETLLYFPKKGDRECSNNSPREENERILRMKRKGTHKRILQKGNTKDCFLIRNGNNKWKIFPTNFARKPREFLMQISTIYHFPVSLHTWNRVKLWPLIYSRALISLASACNVTCLLGATLVSLWRSKQKQHAHKNITMRPWKVLVGGKIHFKLDGQTAYFFSFKGK